MTKSYRAPIRVHSRDHGLANTQTKLATTANPLPETPTDGDQLSGHPKAKAGPFLEKRHRVVIVASHSPPSQTYLELGYGWELVLLSIQTGPGSNGSLGIAISARGPKARSSSCFPVRHGLGTWVPERVAWTKDGWVRVYAETCHAAPRAYRLYLVNAEPRARKTRRKSRSFSISQPVFLRRISDREAFYSAGPNQRVWNARSNLTSGHHHDQGLQREEMKGRKSRDYSLTTTPPGVWPTRSASWMATRHDGCRVICASRRKNGVSL